MDVIFLQYHWNSPPGHITRIFPRVPPILINLYSTISKNEYGGYFELHKTKSRDLFSVKTGISFLYVMSNVHLHIMDQNLLNEYINFVIHLCIL